MAAVLVLHCLVLQAMCNRWAATDKLDTFRDRGDDSCQFIDVMFAAMGTLLSFRQPAFRQWMEALLVQARIPISPFRLINWTPVL